MLINIILGFIIPWIFGVFLYKKAPNIVIIIFPVSSIVSSFINAIGFHLEFWDFTPLIEDDETISALPFYIGLYPLAACSAMYWIDVKKTNPILTLVLLSILLTGLEYIGFLFHKVQYGHGWNIGWTFISYLIATFAAYVYYLLAKNHEVNFKSKK
ncbi:hypothetical protein A8709_26740 [Paenibacillus pectinilyticus]|uniref:Uncharacterized protein n=1 Tax=Paenibacillus pectinilyticus TaxID=512399 RepID=A0A1C1A1Z4_9BACL|nr:hypothetical protein A8709_26740 [Paenibacillus pectinilyticus]